MTYCPAQSFLGTESTDLELLLCLYVLCDGEVQLISMLVDNKILLSKVVGRTYKHHPVTFLFITCLQVNYLIISTENLQHHLHKQNIQQEILYVFKYVYYLKREFLGLLWQLAWIRLLLSNEWSKLCTSGNCTLCKYCHYTVIISIQPTHTHRKKPCNTVCWSILLLMWNSYLLSCNIGGSDCTAMDWTSLSWIGCSLCCWHSVRNASWHSWHPAQYKQC